jgi:catechol 2,3-dioxygenase-like lactoylglutathione lyase family enzyme
MDASMITGLHHLSIAVADLEAGIGAYSALLGCEPSVRSEEDGIRCAYFALHNTALRIVSASGPSATAERLRQLLQTADGVPYELSFAVADAQQARQRLKMISLWPDKIQEFEIRDIDEASLTASWRSLRLRDRSSDLMGIEFVETLSPIPASKTVSDAPVLGAELAVIKTAVPEQALALYGARLGLELVFDGTVANSGNRLAQFSCGGVLLEISHSSSAENAGKPDSIWGIGWSVASAEATHDRLAALGRNVSDVKDGTKPGTRVFTARDGTCGIPTIFVEHVGMRRD